MAGMNIVQMEDAIKGLPDDMLMQQAREPTGQYPQYLLISEIQRRADMRESYAEQLQQEQGTVSDQIIQRGVGGAGPMLPEGGQSMNGAAPQGVGGAGPMFPQMGQPMNGAGSPSSIEQQIQMLLANGVPINDIAGAVGSQNPNQNAVNQGPSFPPQRMARGGSAGYDRPGGREREREQQKRANEKLHEMGIFGRGDLIDPYNPWDYLTTLTGLKAASIVGRGVMRYGPKVLEKITPKLKEGIAALRQWRKAAGEPARKRLEVAAGRRAFKETEKGAAKIDPWKQYDRPTPTLPPRSAGNIPVVRRKLDDLPWPPSAQSFRELGAGRVGEYYGRWMKPWRPDFWWKGTGAAAGGAGTAAYFADKWTNQPTEAERNAVENPNILDSSSMRTTDDKGQSTDQVNNALTEDGSKAELNEQGLSERNKFIEYLKKQGLSEEQINKELEYRLSFYRGGLVNRYGGGRMTYMQGGGRTVSSPFTIEEEEYLGQNRYATVFPPDIYKVGDPRNEAYSLNEAFGVPIEQDPYKKGTALDRQLENILIGVSKEYSPSAETQALTEGLDLTGTDIDYSQFAPDYGLFITEERNRAKKVKEDSMKEARWRTLVQLGAGIAGGSLAEGLSAAGKEAVAAKREGREEAREAEALARRLEIGQETSRGQIGLAGAQAKQARQIAERESVFNAKVAMAELSEKWNIEKFKTAISAITTAVNSEYYNHLRGKPQRDFIQSQYETVNNLTETYAENLLKNELSLLDDETSRAEYMKMVMDYQRELLKKILSQKFGETSTIAADAYYDITTGKLVSKPPAGG